MVVLEIGPITLFEQKRAQEPHRPPTIFSNNHDFKKLLREELILGHFQPGAAAAENHLGDRGLYRADRLRLRRG